MLRSFLQREERALCIDGKQPIEVFFSEIHDRLADQFNAGVGDHNVETTEPLQADCEYAVDVGDLRDVRLDCDSRST